MSPLPTDLADLQMLRAEFDSLPLLEQEIFRKIQETSTKNLFKVGGKFMVGTRWLPPTTALENILHLQAKGFLEQHPKDATSWCIPKQLRVGDNGNHSH